jgi:hypothetical protein
MYDWPFFGCWFFFLQALSNLQQLLANKLIHNLLTRRPFDLSLPPTQLHHETVILSVNVVHLPSFSKVSILVHGYVLLTIGTCDIWQHKCMQLARMQMAFKHAASHYWSTKLLGYLALHNIILLSHKKNDIHVLYCLE